jgi:2,4-dienoyl-CoA reductase-like NADH-dependent reductase (Old Yellow Enzyme family)
MNTNAPSLFTTLRLGNIELPNRIVMAPLTRMRAGEGHTPTPLNAEYYGQRASAGLIITEGTAVSPDAQGLSGSPRDLHRRANRRLAAGGKRSSLQRRPHRHANRA